MTDLEKRADEYAIKVAEKNVMPKDGFAEHLIRQAYLDATKAETALLSQHILDLQKDKGNLTDRVRELETQIEKMKRCYTCKHHTGLGYCKLKQNNGVCENHDKWEFGENDRR